MSNINLRFLGRDERVFNVTGTANNTKLELRLPQNSPLAVTDTGLTLASASIIGEFLAAGAISKSHLGFSVVTPDGATPFTADQSFGGNKLTNVADGSADGDAATVRQVRAIAAGVTYQADVDAMIAVGDATTASVPAAGGTMRFIVLDPTTLNAAFGTIPNLQAGDIITGTMGSFTVAYAVATAGNTTPVVWNKEQSKFLIYSTGHWAAFGGVIPAKTFGQGLSEVGSQSTAQVQVNVDGTTVGINGSNALTVVDGGITETQLQNGAVTGIKLANNVAGQGLTRYENGSLNVSVNGTTVVFGQGDAIGVAANSISATEIAASAVGKGLTGGNGTALSVNAGNGIALNPSTGAVELGALTTAWDLGGKTITGAAAPMSDTDLVSKVWVTTQLQGIPTTQVVTETVTLTAEQITAKTVTLTATPKVAATVTMSVRGAPSQFYGLDFSVTASVLTWAGLGLDTVLLAGDNLTITYVV